jgi:diguanylate cyclase (GGDEF)-like protein
VSQDVPVDWAIRTVPQPGSDAIPVAGDQGLFVDAVDHRIIEVPGGEWEMAAVASPGLLSEGSSLTGMRAAIIAIGVLVGLLAGAVVAEREGFKEMSLHDPLTGLPNRRLLNDRLEHALRASRRAGRGCAVLALDLDGFKHVNDTFGHGVGDEALQETALELVGGIRGRDTVARLGGDEFVVVLPDTTAADALALAQRLRRRLVRTVRDDRGTSRSLGATVGVAHGPTDAATASELLRLADLALYRGKHAGRGVVARPDGEIEIEEPSSPDPEEQWRAALSMRT